MKEPKNFNKPLTKWILFKTAMHPVVAGGVIFGGGFWILIQIVVFFSDNSSGWDTKEGLINGLIVGMFIFCFLIGILAFSSISNDILPIKKIEKVMGISFTDEMDKYNITEMNHKDDLWFLYNKGARVLVMNRNYIKKIKSIKNYNKYGTLLIINAVRFDGEKIKIKFTNEGIRELAQWFLNKDTVDDEFEQATD